MGGTGRYLPERPLPPYAFLPGRDPHPTSDPRGHSFSDAPQAPAVWRSAERWRESNDYLHGCDLYNAGFLWEAHEAWEGLWIAAREDRDQATYLQGLIQCAAACLKIRMEQPRGLEKLAALGTERLEQVARGHGPRYMGLDVPAFVAAFRAFAASSPRDAEGRPRIELET